ncbi:hypothetical protein ACQEUU_06070 [Nonomuraea sp. CA-218870]|uniref:hypothetical protein n=1 Tax=Nonomuraea sp. CA-218870 TaxID=3239998 RepID=UPI003D89E923
MLISTLNEDGTPNLAPMSSAFWLGWRGVLGLGRRSKTARNMTRTRECVLNLPSDALAAAVDGRRAPGGRRRDRRVRGTGAAGVGARRDP